MDSYQLSDGGLWTNKSDINQVEKGFEELYAIVDNRMETFNTKKQDPFQTNYTINRAISLLAQNVAQVPLDIYKGEEPIPHDNEMYNMFIKPNPYMSNFELWELTMIYLYNYGESFWYLNTNEYGKIQEIYVLNPRFMKHTKDKTTGQIGNWLFNHKIPMTIDEVVFFKLPNTKGLRGLSPINTVVMEYAADADAAKYNKKFFENFAKISGYLKNDKASEISPEELRKAVVEWNNAHKGVNNVGKTAGLPAGMDYIDTAMSQKDMEYLEGRKDIRDRILVVLGVNKTAMGISDDVNRANAKEGMRQIWTLTLKPQLIRIQEKLNADLFLEYFPGYRCKFNLSQIEDLKGDLKTTLESAQSMLHMGYTRNEINSRLSLDMEDSDDNEDLLPLNLVPRGMSFEDETDTSKDVVDITTKDVEEVKRSRANDRYRRLYLRRAKVIDKVFYSKVKRFFYEQGKEVLKIIGSRKDMNADHYEILNKLNLIWTEQNKKLKKYTKPIYEEAYKVGVKLAKDRLGKSYKEIELPDLIDSTIINSRLSKITDINNTVWNQIRIEIFESANQGETLAELTKRIKNVYNFAGKRARTIARTETNSMISETTMAEYDKEGVSRKQWIGGDRETHAAQDGDIVDIDETFANGLSYPGDPSGGPGEVINCRCAISPVID